METNGHTQGGGKTAYSTTDWSSYMRGRPDYPPSLIKIIKNYRKLHGSALKERVVDIGGGNGLALSKFADGYDIIHLSDPSPMNIDQASRFLPDFLARRDLKPKVEYSRTTGEEAYNHVGEQSADLVVCATAAHFAVPDKLVESIAKMLRPGGTMAVFSYFMAQFPLQSAEFGETFSGTVFAAMNAIRDHSNETLNKIIGQSFSNMTAGEGGLDYLPIPDEYFKDKQRFIINGSTPEVAVDERLRQGLLQRGEQPGASRVLANEPKIRLQTGRQPLAAGWDQYADKEFLTHFFESMRPAGSSIPDGEFAKFHAECDRLLEQECPSGKVLMRWPCMLILATRK